MALLRDGHINTLDDLVLHESGLLGVTSVERIDLNAKMLLAREGISDELVLFLVNRVGPGRRRVGISDVVITSPLKRWHALRTIELAYEDAYNNQLNDRYRGKWQQYRHRAESAADHLFSLGIGLVADPISRAITPLLLAVAGTSLGAQYYVRMTWTNLSGQEGSASDVVGQQTVDGTQLVVSPTDKPTNAVGWYVYVGFDPRSLSRQNEIALAPGADWICPAIGLLAGSRLGDGQAPEWHVVSYQLNQRG